MALKKITTPALGFTHKANKILCKKCRVFIAEDDFAVADIPATKAALLALHEGAEAKFVPFGDLDSKGSSIKWKQNSVAIDFSEIPTDTEVTGTLINVTLTKEMIAFVDSMGTNAFSFLFIPDGDTETFFAVSGVSVKHEGSLPVVEENELGKVTFSLNRKANQIADVIKLEKLTA